MKDATPLTGCISMYRYVITNHLNLLSIPSRNHNLSQLYSVTSHTTEFCVGGFILMNQSFEWGGGIAFKLILGIIF